MFFKSQSMKKFYFSSKTFSISQSLDWTNLLFLEGLNDLTTKFGFTENMCKCQLEGVPIKTSEKKKSPCRLEFEVRIVTNFLC